MFILFAYERYDATGGIEDLVAIAETLLELEEFINNNEKLIKENETLKTKVDLKTKKIAELNSRVQSRDKIIAKLKENGKVQV